MPKFKACCFTGYRPEKIGFDVETDNMDSIALSIKLSEAVTGMTAKGTRIFYCGCARGFDLLAAETVLMEKNLTPDVKLICVKPFKNMDEGWSPFWKDKLAEILAAADEVITLADEYSRGVYDKRNKYMVDRSGCVITYFDGERGGTASTINYAKKKGIPVINTASDVMTFPNEEDYYTYYTATLPFCD